MRDGKIKMKKLREGERKRNKERERETKIVYLSFFFRDLITIGIFVELEFKPISFLCVATYLDAS